MNDDSVKRARARSGRYAVMLTAAVSAAAVVASGLLAYASPSATGHSPPRPCQPLSDEPPSEQPPAPKPTTISTLQQAYECIFAHHHSAARMDDRTMLASAFKRLTEELQRRGVDQGAATLPRLTGDRDRDWRAFARTYRKLLAALPDDAALRQAVASATMSGMIEALPDNHIGWTRIKGSPTLRSKLGFRPTFEGRPTVDVPPKDIRDAMGPMYVGEVTPESPAAASGLKPGDIVEAVNGVPVFVNGKLTPGVLDLLNPASEQDVVKITVERPATGSARTVEVRGFARDTEPSSASGKLLDGDIAYVTVPSFYDPADDVLKKIAELQATARLRGVILDVRGNGGGRGEQVSKLLGAFAHGKVWGWNCDREDRCKPDRTDDSVALLNLPLVVLTDGRCASACDAFSAAVKDLGLGTLVGARTSGIISGPPESFRLDDNSLLALLPRYYLAANKEIIDGIGVAVDYQTPVTAHDVSTGSDPGVEKAVSLFKR